MTDGGQLDKTVVQHSFCPEETGWSLGITFFSLHELIHLKALV